MMLKTSDGSEFEAYLAGPENAKCGVLILHDWWGVLDYNKAWADRFAALGYKAMVVDLYDGERARTVEEAGEMMRGLDQDQTDAKLIAAVDFLGRGGCRVASLGWSLGGRQAMQAALLAPDDVAATVLFYCRMVSDVNQLGELGGPVLVFYAKQEQTWPAKMEGFDKAMAAAGKRVESFVYDAGHGFANPTSERHNAAATEDAWQKTCEFLDRVFR
jgi:carboxymethylenebutenolidase